MNAQQQLKQLVQIAERWRSTPIVDDDFVGLKNEFDHELRQAAKFLQQPRPKIICLCGSTKFFVEYFDANQKLTREGNIVLSCGSFRHRPNYDYSAWKPKEKIVLVDDTEAPTETQKTQLDQLHLRKIDEADAIYILNVGGYIGYSTARELCYAMKHHKDIFWHEPDKEASWVKISSRPDNFEGYLVTPYKQAIAGSLRIPSSDLEI